jgi:hypothetical protein
MAKSELVIRLGIEGGGNDIFRTPRPSGGWQFHVEGSSMDMDENDDEVWRYYASEPFSTIEEALRSISENGAWVCYYPCEIHADYRKFFWELVQKMGTGFKGQRAASWQRRKNDWRRRCNGIPMME